MVAYLECGTSRGDPALCLLSLFARLLFLLSALGSLRTSGYLSISTSRALCSDEIRVLGDSALCDGGTVQLRLRVFTPSFHTSKV